MSAKVLRHGGHPPSATPGGRGGALPLWLFGGWLGAVGTAALLDYWGVLIPLCGLRLLTGLPCPLCGGTRSLAAVAHLDWWAALTLNPLVCLAGVGLAFWSLARGLDRARHPDPTGVIPRTRLGRKAAWVILVLTALNWAYLLVRPPQ